jgi:hypothetical protein
VQIVSTKVETTGNLGNTEDVLMAMDDAASAFVLNNLVKQYSNPYKAAMQEYLSNALDSHRLVGQKAPVELTLPSDFSPQLVIEDFGRGLDRNELKLFGQFGSSSKRDSNDQIGGFGLGSKSGLAIASQFTVTAVKDGKRNTVIIKRREDGHPMMSFLDEQETTDPNGVRVTIPTRERFKFQDAIDRGFFLGWEEGSVLVNGLAPSLHLSVHNPTNFTPLGDLGWRATKTLDRSSAGLGKGNVALVDAIKYRLDLSQVEGIDSRLFRGFLNEIVIKLENGLVEIHPSRETLIYDKRTREYIKNRVNALVLMGKEVYQNEIDKAPTIREALIVRRKAISLGFGYEYTYKGEPIVITVPVRPEWNPKTPDEEPPPFIGDLQFSTSAIKSGTRTYSSEREKISYLNLLGWGFDQLCNNSDRQVLVYGAQEPTKYANNGTTAYHPETFRATHWATSISTAESVEASEFILYFTTEKDLKKFDKWFLGSFERIISADDYMDVVRESRKAAAKIARENAKIRAVTPGSAEVRVLMWRNFGSSTYTNTAIKDLDTTKTHVLLKSGASELVDQARAAVLTRKGYTMHPHLSVILSYTQKHVVFILANKNQNTADYATTIPNFTEDLKGTLEALAEGIVSQKTEMDKRATLDCADRTYRWAEMMPADLLGRLKNKNTAAWIKAMGESKTYEDTYLQNIVSYGATYNLDPEKAKIVSKIAISPGEAYPILKYLNLTSYREGLWTEVIRYLNLVDSTRADVTKA